MSSNIPILKIIIEISTIKITRCCFISHKTQVFKVWYTSMEIFDEGIQIFYTVMIQPKKLEIWHVWEYSDIIYFIMIQVDRP